MNLLRFDVILITTNFSDAIIFILGNSQTNSQANVLNSGKYCRFFKRYTDYKRYKKGCKRLIYSLLLLVIPKRFERLTHALEGRCSIQLSYGTILVCGCKGSAFFEFSKDSDYFFLIIFLLKTVNI